jgi:hypothetical protein
MPQSVVFDHRKVLPKIDMVTLERCCKAFHEEFKTRRSNCDDGAWALRLLAEIQRRGCPTLRTARQLVGSRYGQMAGVTRDTHTPKELILRRRFAD